MNLSQHDWKVQLKSDSNAVIIDVRTEDEWNEGFIPNAIHIDIFKGQGFIDEIEILDKSKNYYVYCRAGSRSEQACMVMQKIGLINAYNLNGGILNWEGDLAYPL